MPKWHKVKAQIFQWEFWPFWFLYLPVFFYYFCLVLRERSFFFFTASNPSIDFGGMLGESKKEVFSLIPEKYYPIMHLITDESRGSLVALAESIGYPLIAKPDVGERGVGVEIIRNKEALMDYHNKIQVPFLLQEYVSYPVELGIFYVRLPTEDKGRITSIVMKDFLSVVGDGKHTVAELLKDHVRADLQVDLAHDRFREIINKAPLMGEKVIVEQIGNHCRGTSFLDVTFEADERLSHAIDTMAKQIKGFYFGRFDIKCQSIDDLRKLQNFKILELNGAGAEPGHIYQPGFSLFRAYQVLLNHLYLLARISRSNKSGGVQYWTLRRGVKKLMDIRTYNRRIRGI